MTNKPPRGVMPRHLWEEQRITELERAILEFRAAGYSVPQDVRKEYAELVDRMPYFITFEHKATAEHMPLMNAELLDGQHWPDSKGPDAPEPGEDPRIKEYEYTIEALGEEVHEYRTKAENHAEAVNELYKRLADAETHKQRLNEMLEDYEQRLVQKQEEARNLRIVYDAEKRKAERLAALNEQLEDERETLAEEREQLEVDNTQLQVKLDGKKEELHKVKDRLTLLTKEKESLETILVQYQGEAKQYRDARDEALVTVKRRDAHLEDLKQEVQALREGRDTFRKERDTLQGELSEAQQTIGRLQRENERLGSLVRVAKEASELLSWRDPGGGQGQVQALKLIHDWAALNLPSFDNSGSGEGAKEA